MSAFLLTVWALILFFGQLIRRQKGGDPEMQHAATVAMLFATILLPPFAFLCWGG